MLRQSGIIVFVVLLLLAPVRTALADAAQAPGSEPNVVFILLDVLRADRLDAMRNGVRVMPNLANIAALGVRFQNTTSACSWTLPSMASVFTSMYLDAHQAYLASDKLADRFETMAEFLHAAGYTTAGIQTNLHLVAESGFAQGFDTYIQNTEPGTAKAEAVTTQGIQQAQSLTEPFFLYMHYLDPHMPYAPPQSYQTELGYPSAQLTSNEQAVVEDLVPYYWDFLDYQFALKPTRQYAELSSVGKEAVRALYDGECRYVDHEVQRLLDAVLAAHPNTLVVIVADHGDALWEKNKLGHSVTLYQPMVDIPLIFKGPGLTPGVPSGNASNVDVLPTIAGLLGLPPRPFWQGRDLFKTFDPAGPVFSYTQCTGAPYLVNIEMTRFGSVKRIHNLQDDTIELYDLSSDPGELNNLAAQKQDIVDQMGLLQDQHSLQNARVGTPSGAIRCAPGLVERGKPITLTAPAGNHYRWVKDGTLIAEDPTRLTGFNEAALRIITAAPDDAGQYECLYRDTDNRLKITTAFSLAIYPPMSVPAERPWSLALLLIALIAIPLKRLRSRDLR